MCESGAKYPARIRKADNGANCNLGHGGYPHDNQQVTCEQKRTGEISGLDGTRVFSPSNPTFAPATISTSAAYEGASPRPDGESSIVSRSIFGSLELQVSERLDLSAELRYNEDEFEVTPAGGAEVSGTFDALLPKLTLSYQAAENSLLYANVALGIKATASLRLLPIQPSKAYSSFEFEDHETLIRAMSEVSRTSLAEACFDFDPTLQSQRMKRAFLLEDVKTLGQVMKAQGGKLKAVRESIRIASSGRGFMKDVSYSAHFIVEEATQVAADHANGLIREICLEAGGQEIENSIPKISRAVPFPPLNSMIGPGGERWLPVLGLVPHSKAQSTYAALEALFEANRKVMNEYDILHGYMLTYVGTHCFVIEPVFYWPDQLNALHRDTVEDAVLAKVNDFAANPEARAEVLRIRREVIRLFNQQGALHLQIGRTHPFQAGLRNTPRNTIRALKAMLDSEGRINPGSLGV